MNAKGTHGGVTRQSDRRLLRANMPRRGTGLSRAGGSQHSSPGLGECGHAPHVGTHRSARSRSVSFFLPAGSAAFAGTGLAAAGFFAADSSARTRVTSNCMPERLSFRRTLLPGAPCSSLFTSSSFSPVTALPPTCNRASVSHARSSPACTAEARTQGRRCPRSAARCAMFRARARHRPPTPHCAKL
jgi:hypothetical protein